MSLKGLRVLEVGSLAAASYCARLFADFGADVLKFEMRGGDPLRHAAPMVATEQGAASAWFAFLNFGKRLAQEDDARFVELIAEADVLIVGGAWAGRGAIASNPALVVVDASWFGRTGPYADYAASDATCRALGGVTHLVGREEGPPIAAPDFQASFVGGLWAFIAACAGLAARARDGGRRLETSVHEACVTLSEYQAAEAGLAGASQNRMGLNRFVPTYPLGVYPTKDGWIGVTLVTPAQWRGFCDMLELGEIGDDPKFTTGLERLPHAAALEALFVPKLGERTAKEWFAEGLKRKLPMVVAPQMRDLIASPEFRARGALADISIGGRSFVGPASPLRLCATPPASEGALAAQEQAPLWRARAAAPLYRSGEAPRGALPLAGFRILDFTMGWAGPLCARTLADLGADVVKVESCAYPDWWRGVDRRPAFLRDRMYEKSPRFAVMNRNKRGVTLDLTQAAGVRLAKALAMKADAVIDNYSVDVLPKFGLGPDVLRAAKPSLVTMSMSAFGSASPWRECRAYGSTLEQASGLPGLVGAAGDPPVMGHPAFGDPVGGLSGAAALLAALLHARATDEGQHVDLSQVECMMQMVAPWMIAASAGQAIARFGAGHPDHAPHGVYRSAGADCWIAIAVQSDALWNAFCATIGAPHLVSYASARARQAHGGEIDAAISSWTRSLSADAAMAALQRIGVAAGAVRRPFDLADDPHLQARGFWTHMERVFIGRHAQPAMAFREGDAPYPMRWAAPTLGERNDDVLTQLLGLSREEIDELARAGVIGAEVVVKADEAERARA